MRETDTPTPLSEAVARLRYYYVPLPAPIDPPASMDPVYDDEDAEPSQHDRDVLLLLDAVADGWEDRNELEVRRFAMKHPEALRYRNPFAFCPQCGGEMCWTAETILRCARNIEHTAAVAGIYCQEARVVDNPPAVRFPGHASAEMRTRLDALRRATQTDNIVAPPPAPTEPG